jgi:hypothetical protein
VGIIRGSIFAHFFLALLPPALSRLFKPCAVGVGNDPDAISNVVGANGASRYAVPFRIIPERGQVSENDIHPSMKQVIDVFHDDEFRSYLANKSGIVAP